MSISDYERAIRLLGSHGGGSFVGSKPESFVVKAETALGLAFPPSYRRFVRELGCGNFRAFEVYGLSVDNFETSSIPNGIWLTLDERRVAGLDPAYIIIADNGDGCVYAIDTRRTGKSGEAPVVLLSVDRAHSQEVAESFGEFFVRGVESLL